MGQSGVDIVYCYKCVFHMGYLSCKEFILWTWMDIYVSVLYKNRHICLFLRPFNISDIWNYESIIFLRKQWFSSQENVYFCSMNFSPTKY